MTDVNQKESTRHGGESRCTMKTTPILFSGPMVRAIMDGRKTMTRRVMNPQPDESFAAYYNENGSLKSRRSDGWSWKPKNMGGRVLDISNGEALKYSPYGNAGDRLAVKETWCLAPRERWEQWPEAEAFPARVWDGTMDRPHTQSIWNSVHNVIYKADGDYKSSDGASCWTSSVTMPKWASRITLEIVSVKVERLQNIEDHDVIDEGLDDPSWHKSYGNSDGDFIEPEGVAVEAFRELWNQINGKKHPWASNPWVWVYEFKQVKAGAA